MKDLTRLKEAILYIASKCAEDEKFGAVKLNKILYYADFAAYRELGRSITGATYQHLQEGPAPKELLLARNELIRERRIKVKYQTVFNFTQHRLELTSPLNVEEFDTEERRILDETIQRLWPYWGSEVTHMSHEEWGYKLTELGEEIPYRTAWLDSEAGTQDQLDTVRRFAKEKGYALP